MSDLEFAPDNTLSANFIFPVDFLGFKGHFPGKPILPGVCEIQAVLLMLEEFKKKNVLLREIVQIKFFSPVSCDERIAFKLEEKLELNGEVSVKAMVASEDKRIAEIHLRVNIINK
jgi:3-hydroxyacyl-[acyl-carrier-protein] dehydratase